MSLRHWEPLFDAITLCGSRGRAQSLRGAAASIFDATVPIFDHGGEPPNLAVSSRCSIQFGNVCRDFAAAENGDEGFGAPINEPAGKNEYRSNLCRFARHFRRAIRITMPHPPREHGGDGSAPCELSLRTCAAQSRSSQHALRINGLP